MNQMEKVDNFKKHSWKPGQSGNPGGRPKSQFGEYVRQSTGDGKEIIDRVLKIFRETKDQKIALVAADWLATRGWGRPHSLQIIYNGTGRQEELISLPDVE